MQLICTLKWNKVLGARLRDLRTDASQHPELGRVSRPRLADLLLARGIQYTEESIKKLEQGDILSIEPERLMTMLSILGSSIEAFYKVRISYTVVE